MSPLADFLARVRGRSELALNRVLDPVSGDPSSSPRADPPLLPALRHAALGGGKRLRAALVYAAGESFGADDVALDAPACALELIHAYSLVHDDLPCMDDDDLRRGRPTCHKVYGEAIALLAGDALQSCAFEVLATPLVGVAPDRQLRMLRELALAAGAAGMAGGQASDLAAVGTRPDLAALADIHARKTGRLIRAAVRLGALTAPRADEATLARLDSYARALGLLFQITDDLLDVTTPTATLGKPQGSDAAKDKPTYPSLLGVEGARHEARAAHVTCLDSLISFGDNVVIMRELADYVLSRQH